MRTTKPVSTISFNSIDFLKMKLDSLVKAKLLSFYSFIKHLPEDDEKKEHIHVFMEPSKMLQTDDLREELREFDIKHPDKPLGTISFQSSKFGDWYLYSIHDKRYLATKNQVRKYHYCRNDVIASDYDDLDYRIAQIDMLSLMPYGEMLDAQERGESFEQFFKRGFIPIHQVKNFQIAWELLASTPIQRNGRKTHTPK